MPSLRRRAPVIDADSVGEPPQEAGRAADAAMPSRCQRRRPRPPRRRRSLSPPAHGPARSGCARQALAANGHDPAGTNGAAVQTDEPATDETDVADVDTIDVHSTEAETVDSDLVESDTEDGEDAERRRRRRRRRGQCEEPGRRRRLRVPRPNWRCRGGRPGRSSSSWRCSQPAAGWCGNTAKRSKQQQLTAEFAAAGRQSVVTLMSLDFNKARTT